MHINTKIYGQLFDFIVPDTTDTQVIQWIGPVIRYNQQVL